MHVVVYTCDRYERAMLTMIVQQADATSIIAESIENLIERWSDNAADGIVLALSHSDSANVVRRIRHVAIVPLVVIADIHAEAEQVTLYNTGATLVLPGPSARGCSCVTCVSCSCPCVVYPLPPISKWGTSCSTWRMALFNGLVSRCRA